MLLTLAFTWGASYLFIKVAVRELEPPALIAFRLLVAGAALFAVLAVHQGGAVAAARAVGSAWRPGIVLGASNGLLPFWLIAWGEKHVDSGVAAVANSTTPIFVALLAIRFRESERADGMRLAGIAVGLVGVGVLTGLDTTGGWWTVAGTVAVVVASFSYAGAALFAQGAARGHAAPVLACAFALYGFVLMIPFAVWFRPDVLPSGKAIGCVLALALAGTAFAQLVFFRLVGLHGSAKASLVTYLMPPIALFYGATLLDEPLRLGALLGLALILAGVALGSGALRPAAVRRLVRAVAG